MAIRLQIVDKDNSIIQDDELLVEDGDIILCQLSSVIQHEDSSKLAKRIQEAFEGASKRANNDRITTLLHDSKINFKILKIRKD
jgi:hypothetical protein